MNTTTAMLTMLLPRFEAVRLADGWSVVDRLCETAIVPTQPWDEATATLAAGTLNALPAYAVLFRWSEPDERELAAADGMAGVVARGGAR